MHLCSYLSISGVQVCTFPCFSFKGLLVFFFPPSRQVRSLLTEPCCLTWASRRQWKTWTGTVWFFTMLIISLKMTGIITAAVRCLVTSPQSLISTCTCKWVLLSFVFHVKNGLYISFIFLLCLLAYGFVCVLMCAQIYAHILNRHVFRSSISLIPYKQEINKICLTFQT